MAQIARMQQLPVPATNMALPRPTAAVEPRVGELAQEPHLKTPARGAQMSLLAATRVTAPTATRIVESASLLPTTLPVVVGAAEALVALAVALLAVLVALGEAPTVGVATCPGIKSGRPLLQKTCDS